MSNLILGTSIVEDEWNLVKLPVLGEETVRKQAGKVVLFKLTGEKTYSEEQIAATVIPATGKILVPLSLWIARRGELESRLAAGELAIWLDTHEVLADLVSAFDDINQLPLIAVHVERFADGRIFSIGNLLRTRHGYKNTLRAFGDVLRDQLFFLKRCGFDSYLIRADRSAEDALASLKDFSQPYQGAVDDKQPVWRRVSRQPASQP
ncbi:DUF934 domain-containing protein [Methylovorus glucosotrophus]|jgi:uncharacterized protein (DUF934 family)|uniref:Oxidoreductase probably involved in sulfite reduction n=1 Tax=Methylovorus glucosotrophus (strain SIP3-4) TaxID=582744 RepID=C6XDY8_METGS|nr:DUF934 domain-containing protein [Methylovorus glucosotrophus]ACT50763.1 conserved hypothetical protein [Methylovorus glucosotrophus SIP3-4]KAF0843849.1 uncharacterized protein (DUF934 family) [Methylovorus glucosotrophus]